MRSVFFLIVTSVILFSSMAQAGVANYVGACKYIDADGKMRVDTSCDITIATSTLGPAKGVAYFLSFPNGNTVEIREQADGSYSVNSIAAKVVEAGGKVVAVTDEGEIFIFD